MKSWLKLHTKKNHTPYLVCLCHIDNIIPFSWRSDSTNYLKTSVFENGKQTTLNLARVVLGVKGKEVVDHINGNPLDNRCSNLRICNTSQNIANSKKRKDNTSGFKGVTWQGNRYGKKNWSANIGYRGKRLYIGRFYTAVDAAKAYNAKAIELFGEFAKINKIGEISG